MGLGGKASKNKLKDTSFIFPMTNDTILGLFEYGKVLETKGTYIHNILALLFSLKLAIHLLKVRKRANIRQE